jgi:hypothetical protein
VQKEHGVALAFVHVVNLGAVDFDEVRAEGKVG